MVTVAVILSMITYTILANMSANTVELDVRQARMLIERIYNEENKSVEYLVNENAANSAVKGCCFQQ